MNMETIKNKFGLNSFTLKLIAMISMAIDHTGAVLFPEATWLRIIGRLAFPIYCFLLVEGFYYTKDVKKYIVRLGVFALISEIPFDLAFYGKIFAPVHQNVFFTLCIGLILIAFLEKNKEETNKTKKVLLDILVTFLCLLLATILRTDYIFIGVVIILCFYYFRESVVSKIVSISFINILLGKTQSFGIFSLLFIFLYNGKKGPGMKYFFYAFYPVHLVILALIKYYL